MDRFPKRSYDVLAIGNCHQMPDHDCDDSYEDCKQQMETVTICCIRRCRECSERKRVDQTTRR